MVARKSGKTEGWSKKNGEEQGRANFATVRYFPSYCRPRSKVNRGSKHEEDVVGDNNNEKKRSEGASGQD